MPSINLGFSEIAYKIYNTHKNDIDNINKAISRKRMNGENYLLTEVTCDPTELQNYYHALGDYQVVIHKGRTKDLIAIGWAN